jgi:hypothetical protein
VFRITHVISGVSGEDNLSKYAHQVLAHPRSHSSRRSAEQVIPFAVT